jgi:hydroxymethylpyrimidine pyrophosphatase-like HAD family hydrolase
MRAHEFLSYLIDYSIMGLKDMPELLSTPEEEALSSPETDFWSGSELSKKLDRQRELGIQPPHVLITDRDWTHSVFGWSMRHRPPEELAARNAETQVLNEHLQERGTVLIMNTGGSIEMMKDSLEDGQIPADAAIVAGGSEFWVVENGQYVEDPEYRQYIESLGYNRDILYPITQELRHELNSAPDAPAGFGLQFQARDDEGSVAAWEQYQRAPDSEQMPGSQPPQPYKISFYVSGGREAADYARAHLESKLEQLGQSRFKVTTSADPYNKEGRYMMDLLPVDKLEAFDKVVEILERRFGPVTAAAAGDSEHDTTVILGGGVAGIAVGNRQEQVDTAIEDAEATRVTKHFKIVNGRLIYRDDTKYSVAVSLYRAVRALEMADVLIKNR